MAATSGKKFTTAQSSKLTRNITLLLCAMGLFISVFALYIEIMKEKNPDYIAICDINSYMMCSRALTSRYGKGFGIVDRIFSNSSILNQPNPVYGMAFYTFQATLALSSSSSSAVVQTFFNILANIGSVYLAYILYFVIHDLCLVCLSTYVVNFFLLIVSWFRLRTALQEDIRNSKKKKH